MLEEGSLVAGMRVPEQIETEDQADDGKVIYLVKWQGVEKPGWATDAETASWDWPLVLAEWEEAKASGAAEGQGGPGSDEVDEYFCDGCDSDCTKLPLTILFRKGDESEDEETEDICQACYDGVSAERQAEYRRVDLASAAVAEGTEEMAGGAGGSSGTGRGWRKNFEVCTPWVESLLPPNPTQPHSTLHQ